MKRIALAIAAYAALTGAAQAGHYAAVGQGTCSYCHKTNLITQHGGFAANVCSKCHSSTNSNVITTIANGVAGQQYACANCHGASGHLDVHGNYMANFTQYKGVEPTATVAWTPNTTFTTVSPSTKQYQVCLKCHSSNGFGTASGAVSPIIGPSGVNLTDQAMEFNPKNMSFHPILASAGSNQGATNNIKAPFTRTSIMTCGDCHTMDPLTDPNGPHPTATKFLLKGPNTAWDSTLTLLSDGKTSSNTIFCANCHDLTWKNSRFPSHNEGGDHSGIPCFNCHVAIPHGSQRMGMLVAPAGAATGSAPITDKAPYNQSVSGKKLYIKSYPSATSTWSDSNCGCNGTSH